jgi:hypothetical protein
MILFQQMVSNKISKLLAKHTMKTTHVLVKKNTYMLRMKKDRLGLKVAGIYCVPCECGKVYAGQASNPSKPNVRNI